MQVLPTVLGVTLAPVRPISRAVVWLYGRTFNQEVSRVLGPVAELFCWAKTVLYAATALLLIFVLLTAGDAMLERPEDYWVLPLCVTLTYVNVLLALAHRLAAMHFRRNRRQLVSTTPQ